MSGIDTARLLLAGVPGAREVEYHEWTAAPPSCRGELRAAGEVLWFTYAGPPRDLPGPGEVIIITRIQEGPARPPRPAMRAESGAFLCAGQHGGRGAAFFLPEDKVAEWIPARVIPESFVTDVRDAHERLVDHGDPWSERFSQAEDLLEKALRLLDGAT